MKNNTKLVRLYTVYIVLALGLGILVSCNIAPFTEVSGLALQSQKGTAHDQVDFFQRQADIMYYQFVDSTFELSDEDIQNGHTFISQNALKVWQKIELEMIEELPVLATAKTFWPIEASQLVSIEDQNRQSDYLVGYFVIAAYTENGFSNWAVMLTVNLENWKILNWTVNKNFFDHSSSHIPIKYSYNLGSGYTHTRRVTTIAKPIDIEKGSTISPSTISPSTMSYKAVAALDTGDFSEFTQNIF